jgi:hypothetical protein
MRQSAVLGLILLSCGNLVFAQDEEATDVADEEVPVEEVPIEVAVEETQEAEPEPEGEPEPQFGMLIVNPLTGTPLTGTKLIFERFSIKFCHQYNSIMAHDSCVNCGQLSSKNRPKLSFVPVKSPTVSTITKKVLILLL